MQWSFTSTKTLVCHGKKLMPLSQLIKDNGVSSLARHAPKWLPGKDPSTLKHMHDKTPLRMQTKSDMWHAILKHCGDKGTAHVAVAWNCSIKASDDADKSVVPTGVALYVTKQVIVPVDGEVRV